MKIIALLATTFFARLEQAALIIATLLFGSALGSGFLDDPKVKAYAMIAFVIVGTIALALGIIADVAYAKAYKMRHGKTPAEFTIDGIKKAATLAHKTARKIAMF